MASRADLILLLQSRLRDNDNVLAQAQLDHAIDEALQDYSRLRPRMLVVDIVGDGGFQYALANTGYEAEFSQIESIELYDAARQTPEYLDPNEYTVYQSPTGYFLRLFTLSPAATDTLRVTMTASQTATYVTTTVPSADLEAVANRAASAAALWLAMHYAQQGDPTFNAEVGEHRSKSEHYSRLAREMLARYNVHMGVSERFNFRDAESSGVAAANARADWDANLSWGWDRLTHPRRWY